MSGTKGKRPRRSSVLLSGKWFSLKVSSENKTYESSTAMYDTYLLKIDPKKNLKKLTSDSSSSTAITLRSTLIRKFLVYLYLILGPISEVRTHKQSSKQTIYVYWTLLYLYEKENEYYTSTLLIIYCRLNSSISSTKLIKEYQFF
jgi:hypothetical protein